MSDSIAEVVAFGFIIFLQHNPFFLILLYIFFTGIME